MFHALLLAAVGAWAAFRALTVVGGDEYRPAFWWTSGFGFGCALVVAGVELRDRIRRRGRN